MELTVHLVQFRDMGAVKVLPALTSIQNSCGRFEEIAQELNFSLATPNEI
jgi:hypothetical protein